jgi:hypothetical protein
MTIKDIIEKIEKRKTELEKYQLPESRPVYIELNRLLPGLEKANELQEEMANYIKFQEMIVCQNCKRLVEDGVCLGDCEYCQEEGVKLLEKYYNKSWEEIIKE